MEIKKIPINNCGYKYVVRLSFYNITDFRIKNLKSRLCNQVR